MTIGPLPPTPTTDDALLWHRLGMTRREFCTCAQDPAQPAFMEDAHDALSRWRAKHLPAAKRTSASSLASAALLCIVLLAVCCCLISAATSGNPGVFFAVIAFMFLAGFVVHKVHKKQPGAAVSVPGNILVPRCMKCSYEMGDSLRVGEPFRCPECGAVDPRGSLPEAVARGLIEHARGEMREAARVFSAERHDLTWIRMLAANPAWDAAKGVSIFARGATMAAALIAFAFITWQSASNALAPWFQYGAHATIADWGRMVWVVLASAFCAWGVGRFVHGVQRGQLIQHRLKRDRCPVCDAPAHGTIPGAGLAACGRCTAPLVALPETPEGIVRDALANKYTISQAIAVLFVQRNAAQ